MKRLPAAKRNHLIMVVLATAALISIVYFALIRPQLAENEKIAAATRSEQDRFQQMQKIIKQADATGGVLADISLQLTHAEDDVATGDVYAWTYDTIRRFKSAYHVEIPNPGQPTVGEVDLLAAFPYKQVRVSLTGTAYYHDFGKFVADFENNFPHMRMVNLSMEPASVPGANSERLSFRVDIIALFKPNT